MLLFSNISDLRKQRGKIKCSNINLQTSENIISNPYEEEEEQ